LVYFLRFGMFGPRKIWQPWCGQNPWLGINERFLLFAFIQHTNKLKLTAVDSEREKRRKKINIWIRFNVPNRPKFVCFLARWLLKISTFMYITLSIHR
jgi:hypothetical protein